MKHLPILLALISTPCFAATYTDEQCSIAVDIAKKVLDARKNGATENQVMDQFRAQKIYSGLPVWAAKQAFDAPLDTPGWMLGGALFGECRKKEVI